MKKHAYLIIAHTQFELLKILLECLDYEFNDIFIHIDQKVDNFDEEEFRKICKKSNVIFLKDRISVTWGDFSQIKCELDLLDEATKNNKYQYYHLMSGVDLPLKTQEEIHGFFSQYKGKEFVHFENIEVSERELKKVNKYHFIIKKNKNFIEKCIYKISMLFQCFTNRSRKYGIKYQKGANWFSITDEFARYILQKRELIHKVFKRTYCADEFFVQTLLYESPYIKNLYNQSFNDDYSSIQYFIDWERGNPYEFDDNDYDLLIKSDMLFARKFNYDKSQNLIQRIRLKIKGDDCSEK